MPPKKRLAPKIAIRTPRRQKLADERPLYEQWQKIESDALQYVHAGKTPDRIVLAWLTAFGEGLAERNDDQVLAEFRQVEETVRRYHDEGNAVDRSLLSQMRGLSRRLRQSGV